MIAGLGSVSFAPLSMAISTTHHCEVRALVMHFCPDGIEAGQEPLAGFSADERRPLSGPRKPQPAKKSAPCGAPLGLLPD